MPCRRRPDIGSWNLEDPVETQTASTRLLVLRGWIRLSGLQSRGARPAARPSRESFVVGSSPPFRQKSGLLSMRLDADSGKADTRQRARRWKIHTCSDSAKRRPVGVGSGSFSSLLSSPLRPVPLGKHLPARRNSKRTHLQRSLRASCLSGPDRVDRVPCSPTRALPGCRWVATSTAVPTWARIGGSYSPNPRARPKRAAARAAPTSWAPSEPGFPSAIRRRRPPLSLIASCSPPTAAGHGARAVRSPACRRRLPCRCSAFRCLS